jgi:SAM-dependent methyltransferase
MKQLASSITNGLRNQIVISDAHFDRLFPPSQRLRSRVHWTPIEIAVRACSLLAGGSNRRALDVGSGVGKLCFVGALTTRAHWTGIEKDARMVDVARRAGAKLGVDNQVEFLHGDATRLDWSGFDAIYLFNPLGEMLLDSTLERIQRRERYIETVHRVQQRLVEVTLGTRVVTYHGFGGEMPEGFSLLQRQTAGNDQLCVWMRVRRAKRATDAQRQDAR